MAEDDYSNANALFSKLLFKDEVFNQNNNSTFIIKLGILKDGYKAINILND
jgi:hypothetical protein